mgnify:CR=1 FL=1
MSVDIQEQLSALMDGELGRDERAFLMRRIEHDAQLRALWTRMHLVRDVMAHRPGGAPLNLADRVMQTLADESRAQPKEKRANGKAWRPWVGAALAASVALIAVLAVAPNGGLNAPNAPLADNAQLTRTALPMGVPGPMVPSLVNLGDGVQPVAGERSRVLTSAPTPITAEQMLLMRHGQMVDGAWWVGGAQPVYAQPREPMLLPVSASGEPR